MKSAWIPLAVGLLGVGLGWFLGDAVRAPVPATPGPEAVERAAEPTPPSEPTLVGLPVPPRPSAAITGTSPVPPAPRSGPTAEDLEVLELLDDEDFEELIGFESMLDPTGGDHRGWHALLTLYALAGRLADFQRVVPRALEAGLDRDALLALLQLLPVEHRVAALDHVLATHPAGAWNVGTLADIYTGAGAGERAVDLLVPALEAGADVDLARRLVLADPDRAARILGAMSGGEDWTAGMLGQLGTAFVGVQRPDLALVFLQDALAREPINYEVLTALGEVDATLALAHARDLAQQYADRQDVWTWLGQLEADAGHPEAAFEAWREAAGLGLTTEVLYGMMSADPERAYEAAVELSDTVTDDEVLGAVAKVALKSGRLEDTMATLLRAHERDPSDHEWMTAMVALDPERATQVLGRSAASYGGDGRDEVLGAHGNALLGLGRTDEAYERYREAFELDPGDWEWQRGLARTAPEQAIPLLEARRAEAGDEGDLLGALADAYAGAGRNHDALALYQQALDAGGGDEWYPRMGRIDSERALEALERRVRESPEAGEAWGALGDLQRELGHREAAHAAYDRARALNSTNLVYEIRYRQTGG